MKAQTIETTMTVEAANGAEFEIPVSGYCTPDGGIGDVQIVGFPEATGEQHDAAVEALQERIEYLRDRDDAEREDAAEAERESER